MIPKVEIQAEVTVMQIKENLLNEGNFKLSTSYSLKRLNETS